MDNILKGIGKLWIDLAIGAALLIFVEDIRWFLMFLFIDVLFVSWSNTNYLRKLIRVFQVANEAKIMAIANKVGVTREEIEKIAADEEEKIGAEKWKELEKDFADLAN
ncbi:MAG: hypothetical protein ACYC4I_02230 [Minisyncoccota bacterium]